MRIVLILAVLLLPACGGGSSGQPADTTVSLTGVWYGTFVSDVTGQTDDVTAVITDRTVYLFYGTFMTATGTIDHDNTNGTGSLKIYEHETVGVFRDKYNPYGRESEDVVSLSFSQIEDTYIIGTYQRDDDQGQMSLEPAKIGDVSGDWMYRFTRITGTIPNDRATDYLITLRMSAGEYLVKSSYINSQLEQIKSTLSFDLSISPIAKGIYSFVLDLGSQNLFEGVATKGNGHLLIIAFDDDQSFLIWI